MVDKSCWHGYKLACTSYSIMLPRLQRHIQNTDAILCVQTICRCFLTRFCSQWQLRQYLQQAYKHTSFLVELCFSFPTTPHVWGWQLQMATICLHTVNPGLTCHCLGQVTKLLHLVGFYCITFVFTLNAQHANIFICFWKNSFKIKRNFKWNVD